MSLLESPRPGAARSGALVVLLVLVCCLPSACRSSGSSADGPSGDGAGNALAPAPAPTTLEDVDWLLDEVGGLRAETVFGPDGAVDRFPSVRFDGREGVVTGHTGCNAMHGGFLRAGAFVEVGPLGVTRRACPPPLARLESAFLEALAGTRTYEIRDGGLRWMDANGRLLATFRAAAASDGDARPKERGPGVKRGRVR